MKFRALKPVLTALQEAGIPYHWGFPFYLQATKNGRSVTLCTKDDRLHFLSTLGLNPVDFPELRGDKEAAGFSAVRLSQPWLQMSQRRSRGRSRPRQELD